MNFQSLRDQAEASQRAQSEAHFLFREREAQVEIQEQLAITRRQENELRALEILERRKKLGLDSGTGPD